MKTGPKPSDEFLKRKHQIAIEYPTSAVNKPRWGYGSPPHPLLTKILDRHRTAYKDTLNSFFQYADQYRLINLDECLHNPTTPHLKTPWLPGLDSLSLYCLIALLKPDRIIEVGSGNSTKFARKAISDFSLKTAIISIDPEPRSEIDEICDEVIRRPVETVDLSLFDSLGRNDILFVDNSHRCFMNSDVTVVFLDIIPRLCSGVFVQIHDIFLPYDYPPHWTGRYYSEQYLLASYLLAEGGKIEIILPGGFVSKDCELRDLYAPIFEGLDGVSTGGGSFWLKIV